MELLPVRAGFVPTRAVVVVGARVVDVVEVTTPGVEEVVTPPAAAARCVPILALGLGGPKSLVSQATPSPSPSKSWRSGSRAWSPAG